MWFSVLTYRVEKHAHRKPVSNNVTMQIIQVLQGSEVTESRHSQFSQRVAIKSAAKIIRNECLN